MLLPGAVETQLKRDAGLTLFDYHVLAMLSEAPGKTRLMTVLAFPTNSSLSRLSHVVTRLEKHGWLRREACPQDGRATLVVLTDAGWNHVVEQAPGHVREVRRVVFANLSAEDIGPLS